jgi:hypothetical protein
MEVILTCEYGERGVCRDEQVQELGKCPNWLRVACAAAWSEKMINSDPRGPLRILHKLANSEQPMLSEAPELR